MLLAILSAVAIVQVHAANISQSNIVTYEAIANRYCEFNENCTKEFVIAKNAGKDGCIQVQKELGKFYIGYCHMGLAVIENNVEFCTNTFDTRTHNQCIHLVASETYDANICTNITNIMEQLLCVANVAASTRELTVFCATTGNDADFCTEPLQSIAETCSVYGGNHKNICELQAVYGSRMQEDCATLQSPYNTYCTKLFTEGDVQNDSFVYNCLQNSIFSNQYECVKKQLEVIDDQNLAMFVRQNIPNTMVHTSYSTITVPRYSSSSSTSPLQAYSSSSGVQIITIREGIMPQNNVIPPPLQQNTVNSAKNNFNGLNDCYRSKKNNECYFEKAKLEQRPELCRKISLLYGKRGECYALTAPDWKKDTDHTIHTITLLLGIGLAWSIRTSILRPKQRILNGILWGVLLALYSTALSITGFGEYRILLFPVLWFNTLVSLFVPGWFRTETALENARLLKEILSGIATILFYTGIFYSLEHKKVNVVLIITGVFVVLSGLTHFIVL